MNSKPRPRRLRTLAIIVPVYNEADVVSRFNKSLRRVLDSMTQNSTVIYIDDGSTDRTPEELAKLAARDRRIGVATLSRNFGHQAALTAGLQLAEADAVITMDGDGQNPADLIPEMIRQAEMGYDVVQAKRQGRSGQGWLKDLQSRFFYWLINLLSGTQISPGVADFRLFTRPALEALRELPEYHRFLRGMTAWIGFPTVTLPYEVAPRIGGKSKYSLGKMTRLAADAMFSFTLRPLHIMVGIGLVFILFAFAELIYVASFWLRGIGSQLAPGWSSLMFVVLFVGGTTLVSLGITGMYIGYIFQEAKRRPVYIVRSFRKPTGKRRGTD